MDATLSVHAQQKRVRATIQERIDLALYHKRFAQ